MSITSFLWSNYKALEEKVFQQVYTYQGKTKPTHVNALVDGIDEFLKSCSEKQKKKIHSHVKEALAFRKEAWDQYLIRQEGAQERGDKQLIYHYGRSIRRHVYFFDKMNAILPHHMRVKLTELDSHQQASGTEVYNKSAVSRFTPLEVEGEKSDSESESSSYSAPMRTIQIEQSHITEPYELLVEDEFGLFCTAIVSDLEEILLLWSKLVKGMIKPYVAAAAINVVYCNIKVSFEKARLLYDEDGDWFGMDHLNSAEHPFRDGQRILLEPDSMEEEFELINGIIASALKVDRSIAPLFLRDMADSCYDALEGPDRGFHVFKFSVWCRLLLLGQQIEGLDRRFLVSTGVDIGKDLQQLLGVLSHPRTLDLLDGEVPSLALEAERLNGLMLNLKHVSLVCSVSFWCKVNQYEVFRLFLEDPMITMTAHVYLYLQVAGCAEHVDQLRLLCQKHSDLLFWNGQPSTMSDWHTSYTKWVIPTSIRAYDIAKSRSMRIQQNSLLRELACNGFKLTSDMQKKKKLSSQSEGIFTQLIFELEEEEPFDTVSLFEKVHRVSLDIIASLSDNENLQDMKVDDQDLNTARKFYKHIAEASKPFISQLKVALAE